MKIDPSRRLDDAVLDTVVGDLGDRAGLPSCPGDDDWLRGAALVVLSGGNAHYSSAAHDHTIGRCKTLSRIGRPAGGE